MTPRELVEKIQASPRSNENIFEYHGKLIAMVEAFRAAAGAGVDPETEKRAIQGIEALRYVQDEIRYLTAIDRTREGDHALRVFQLMLRQVWEKQFVNGEFLSLEDIP
jgi:hypothetical protein